MIVKALMLIALVATTSAASAQSYPSRPMRFVLPFPPGGGTDTIARLISGPLSERIGQQVVIDNRPGANAIIGTDVAARAAPDGHTMLYAIPANLSVNSTLYKQLPHDPSRDFAPVIQIGTVALLLVVHPSLPVKTVNDLVRLARARPGQLNFSSSGHGSSAHLAVELIKSMANVDMVHVPFKGGGPALNAVIAGEVQLSSNTMIAQLPHVKAGRLRAVAVTTDTRVPALPEVPAIGETLIGYGSSIWHGIVVPKATPASAVRRLNSELNAILKLVELRERLFTSGVEPIGGSPEAFGALIDADTAKYGKLLKDIGLAHSVTR
jgi:tripartite-type tricarboxylate transporter receptor subunit TctC